MSLLPDPNRDLLRTGQTRFRLRQGGESRGTAADPSRRSEDPGSYARRESNPHQRGPRPRPSTCLRHERMEPSSGADPDLAPYGGAVTAVCDGTGWPSRPRTRELRGQGPAGLPIPLMAIGAEGAIRTHKPRGLGSRGLPVAFTPALVRHLGLEPRLRHRLRACRSSIELAAQVERMRRVELPFSAWRAAALPLSYIRTVGPAGNDPACSWFSARR
jgi:hypothetical protein